MTRIPLSIRRGALLAIIAIAATSGAAIVLADPSSPVSITDVVSPDPVASGAQITHSITIVNTGGAKISNVVMSDQLNGIGGIGVPPQIQIASSRGSCAQTGTLITCNAGDIEGRGSWTISIRGLVTAADGTVLNNTVSVTGTKSAQNFTTTNTTSTLVSNGGGSNLPELSINKTGPTSVVMNAAMTYTLTVNNTGAQNATDIRVIDTVPAGLTGITASGTSLFVCGVAGQTVTCDGGAVNQGSNATITINAFAPNAVGQITNTAVVDPDNTIAESNELNNTSALVNTQVTDLPDPPALSINITDDPTVITGAGPFDPVVPGALLTYKILVTNTAATRADDVVIVLGTQGLEASSVMVSQQVTNGTVGNSGGCTAVAPQARCVVRTLNPTGTIEMTVSGFVIGSAGSFMIGTATVTGNIKNKGVTNTDTELTTVMPQFDLTITKSDSPDPVCASSWPGNVPPTPTVCRGGLTYTFVIGNSGIQDATGVTVRDPLPAGVIFDSVTANTGGFICNYTAPTNVLLCEGGSVPKQSTVTLQFVTVAPAGVGQITNTVTVDPNNAIFEADESNNTFTQTTQVATGIDLTVSKVDSAPGFDPIATNGTQTWTITVDNLGTQDATNIRVRDTLPEGTTFRSATSDNGFTCSHSNGIVECVGGAIRGTRSEFYPPPGLGDDTATIVIRAFARSFVGSGVNAMHNEVRVDPLNEIVEADETNNVDIEDTDVIHGGSTNGAFNQLTIDKTQTDPPNNVARNAIVTYSIVVGNEGTDPAVDVAVRDFPPAGSRYIEMTGSNEFHCVEGEGEVNCTGGQIPAGGNATLTLKVFAPDTPGTYTNQAIVDPGHAIPEGNETDNTDSQETIVENGGNGDFNDLSVTKTASPSPVKPNQELTYTVTVSNTEGEAPALNVKVRDVLPSQVTFVSALDLGGPGAFTCSESSLIVTCVGGTIPAGGSRNITIKVKAPNQTDVTLFNQVMVDPENEIPEGNESNNNFDLSTLVSSNINLTIKKDGPNTSSQGQVATYKITVENQSPSSQGVGADAGQVAFNVEVHDPLPVGLIPLAVDTGSNNNFQCQVLENPINVIDCIGDLPPDSPVEISIDVFMTAEGSRSLDNEACVDPSDTIKEFSKPDGSLGETDNCSTHTALGGTPPKRSPNFLTSKSVNQSVASPGETLEYTITVSNIGDADHLGLITVTDNLPDDTTAVDITGPNGWTCSTPADSMTCDNSGLSGDDQRLAVGASVQFTVHATVKDDANGQLVNGASVSNALHDPADADAEDETAANQPNNSATATTSVGSPGIDLSIGTITDTPDPVNAGQQITWTVVAVNAGTNDESNVHVEVTLPAGISFVGADGSNGFNCDAPVGSLVDCHAATMPAGGNTTITIKALVLLAAPGTLTLSAHIDPRAGESNTLNNDQSEVTTVSGAVCTGCVDLVSALLLASPEPAAQNGSVTVKYVIINTGDMPTSFAAGQPLAFFDFGGAHTSFSLTSSDPANFTCTNVSSTATQELNDCFGNLGPGQGVTFTATIGGLTGSSLTITGRADPGGLISEFLETNNNLTQTVVINP